VADLLRMQPQPSKAPLYAAPVQRFVVQHGDQDYPRHSVAGEEAGGDVY